MESYNFTVWWRQRSELGAAEGSLTCGKRHTTGVPLGSWPWSAGGCRVQGETSRGLKRQVLLG